MSSLVFALVDSMLGSDLNELSLDFIDQHKEALDAMEACDADILEIFFFLAPHVYLFMEELNQVIHIHHMLWLLVYLYSPVTNFSQPLVHKLAVILDQ